MENLRNDIIEFLKSLITTLLGFFNGTENELSEETIAGIENFVNTIFGA